MLVRRERANNMNRKKIQLRVCETLRCLKRSGIERSFAAILAKGLCLCLLTTGCSSFGIFGGEKTAHLLNQNSALSAQEVAAKQPKRANFEQELKSEHCQCFADWVVDSGDNGGITFAIVDKTDAKVFVFYADGRLRGAAPVLLGLGRGDEAIPGIGDRKLSEISPNDRTTPAGRFVASIGYNYKGKDVLWVDYNGAVSMHRVVTAKPEERRLERLATPTPLDNRISYGCINVPAKFFDDVVSPAFSGTVGIVYVLPEVRAVKEVFASYYEVK